MSVRSAALRSLLVVVAGGFSAAGRVTGAASGASESGNDETGGKTTMTPPTPLGPRASAGRQAVMTGVGPGPESERDD